MEQQTSYEDYYGIADLLRGLLWNSRGLLLSFPIEKQTSYQILYKISDFLRGLLSNRRFPMRSSLEYKIS